MRRKLIELSQENLITCDNPNCDYRVPNPTKDPNVDALEYVNMPCPECGENLLTAADYLQGIRIIEGLNWINKWFSWLTYVVPGKPKKSSIHVHNGIHFKDASQPEPMPTLSFGTWYPIESAPKDGTVFIGLEDDEVYKMKWVTGIPPVDSCFRLSDGNIHKIHIWDGEFEYKYPNPTHWTPLPELPKE